MRNLLVSMILVVLTAACGQQGPAGSNGATGAAGTNGTNGSNGAAGATGATGAAGTQIVPVKFCAENAVYPSVFPEYGLCINNQMYGVYSTNGGFLALLPPGYYSSQGVGSACNFSILANCGISR